jgi:hypothetical protein
MKISELFKFFTFKIAFGQFFDQQKKPATLWPNYLRDCCNNLTSFRGVLLPASLLHENLAKCNFEREKQK